MQTEPHASVFRLEILRLADENAALMADAERLKTALDQATTGMEICQHTGEIVIYLNRERHYVSTVETKPELAAYLKERA